jgi:chromosomal replication initiation ATPase DnaA
MEETVSRQWGASMSLAEQFKEQHKARRARLAAAFVPQPLPKFRPYEPFKEERAAFAAEAIRAAEQRREAARQLREANELLLMQTKLNMDLIRHAQKLETHAVVAADNIASLRDRIRIQDIMRVVCRHYGVTRNEIICQRRHQSIVTPRQVVMYIAKKITTRSFPEIGRRLGNRDHTTVMSGCRKIERLRAMDPILDATIDGLIDELTRVAA